MTKKTIDQQTEGEVQSTSRSVFANTTNTMIKDTLDHLEDVMIRTGIRKGLALSINVTNTLFNVTVGDGIIVERNPDPTASVVTRIAFPATLAITDPNLVDPRSYVWIDKLGNLTVETAGPVLLSDIDTRLFLGTLVHTAGVISEIIPNPIIAHGATATEMAQMVFGGGITVSGGIITGNGANLLLDIAEALLQQYGTGFTPNANNPNTITEPAQTPISVGNFILAHVNGSGDLVLDDTSNVLDPTQFNDGGLGTLVDVPNMDFTIIRVFYSAVTHKLYFYYGTEAFTNLANALEGGQPTFVEHPDTLSFSPVARIIIRENVTNIAGGILVGTVVILPTNSRI